MPLPNPSPHGLLAVHFPTDLGLCQILKFDFMGNVLVGLFYNVVGFWLEVICIYRHVVQWISTCFGLNKEASFFAVPSV